MAELGPEEGRALCEALEGPAPTSVRLHPQRPCRWSGAEAVPWSPAGRYLTERPSFTLDPAFHAGAYYVQEASSQFVGHLLAAVRTEGARILDLCAKGGSTSWRWMPPVPARGCFAKYPRHGTSGARTM